jgi:hypothetical protein
MYWYLIYTRPEWKLKIYKALLENGIDAYCPTYSELGQWSDHKKIQDHCTYGRSGLMAP